MNRMRILQLWSIYGVGGITRHVMDLSQWMRAHGHHVTMAGSADAWLDRERDPTFQDMPLRRVTSEGGAGPARAFCALSCAIATRRLIKREKIQFVHAHESAPALVAGLATLGLRIPVAVTYHGSEPDRVLGFGKTARRFADWVITPSHNAAKALHQIGGVPKERLRVIGLGIEHQPPANPEARESLRQEMLDKTGRFLVVTVARLTHQKGIDILVKVVRRVLEQRRDIQFVVVGDGPQEEEAPRWAADAGVETHLHFIGRKDNPHLYMAAADILLLTSRWEALPITIVEALRQALPVIATDCSGVSEMVDDRVGRVVPVEDVEAISRAVLDIVPDESMRRRMSAAAAERSHEDRFAPEAVHRKFEQAYAEMIAAH